LLFIKFCVVFNFHAPLLILQVVLNVQVLIQHNKQETHQEMRYRKS